MPEFDVSGLLVDRMLQPGYLLFRELIPYFGFWRRQVLICISSFGSSISFGTLAHLFLFALAMESMLQSQTISAFSSRMPGSHDRTKDRQKRGTATEHAMQPQRGTATEHAARKTPGDRAILKSHESYFL